MSYDTILAHAEAHGGAPPGGVETVFGGVRMLRYDINKGDILISHCHGFDHPAILASGVVEVWTQDGGLIRFEGPAEIKIPAKMKHAVQVVEDAVWYCLWPESVKETH